MDLPSIRLKLNNIENTDIGIFSIRRFSFQQFEISACYDHYNFYKAQKWTLPNNSTVSIGIWINPKLIFLDCNVIHAYYVYIDVEFTFKDEEEKLLFLLQQ